MGGKRPDQYDIDPGEAGATDYKSRGEGRSGGEKIPDAEKQKLASNPHDQPMIPESGVNPALRARRDVKHQGAAGDESANETPMRASAAESDEDEEARLDQIAEESFPASDPPPGPISIGPKGKGPANR